MFLKTEDKTAEMTQPFNNQPDFAGQPLHQECHISLKSALNYDSDQDDSKDEELFKPNFSLYTGKISGTKPVMMTAAASNY